MFAHAISSTSADDDHDGQSAAADSCGAGPSRRSPPAISENRVPEIVGLVFGTPVLRHASPPGSAAATPRSARVAGSIALTGLQPDHRRRATSTIADRATIPCRGAAARCRWESRRRSVRPTSTPKKSGGVTPTIVKGTRSTVSVRPIDVGGAAEAPLPEGVADDGDRAVRAAAPPSSASVNVRPENRSHAEHVEEVAARPHAVDELCLAALRQVETLRRTTRRRRRTAAVARGSAPRSDWSMRCAPAGLRRDRKALRDR